MAEGKKNKKGKKSSKFNPSVNDIITCAVYVVIGVLFIWLRGGLINILMTIIGALFIVLGIVDIVMYCVNHKETLIRGIVETVVGIALILFSWLLIQAVFVALGILIITKGIIDLSAVINAKSSDVLSWIIPIATIVLGILVILGLIGAIVDVICIIVGVLFIINGVLALFGRGLGLKKPNDKIIDI